MPNPLSQSPAPNSPAPNSPDSAGPIPVVKTIAYAYAYTFGNLGTIIRLIWLPMIFVVLSGYFIIAPFYSSFSQAAAQENPGAIGQAMLPLLFFSTLSFIFYAMIFVAITRHALGIPQTMALFRVPLGKAEWRMFGALLSLIGAMLILSVIVLFVGGILGTIISIALGAFGMAPDLAKMAAERGNDLPVVDGPTMASASLIVAFVYAALVYMAIRLGYLLVPATVAEEKISLARSWQLSRGHAWRICVVVIGTVLPIMAIVMLIQFSIVGADTMLPAEGNDLAETAARMERIKSTMPYLLGLSFITAPMIYGLMLGGSAIVYRVLVPPKGQLD